MKSLKESLFDSNTQTMESLFDKDLTEKDIKSTIGDYFEYDKFKDYPIYDGNTGVIIDYINEFLKTNDHLKHHSKIRSIKTALKEFGKYILNMNLLIDSDGKPMDYEATNLWFRHTMNYLVKVPRFTNATTAIAFKNLKGHITASEIDLKECSLIQMSIILGDYDYNGVKIYIQLVHK